MAYVLQKLFDFLARESSSESGEGLESTIGHTWRWPAWATLALLLASAALVAYVYARERNGAGRAMRWLLGSLRFGLLALVVFMMYGWMRERHRTDLPDLAIVIDDSASMATADPFGDTSQQAAASARVQAAGFDEATRLNLAKTILLENDAALLGELQRRYHVRLYRAGGAARAAGASGRAGDDLATVVEQLRDMQAEEPLSRLGKSLLDVLQFQRGRPTAAVLMFTDGLTTEGKSLGETAEQARRKQTPLFLVGLGDDKPPRDVKLSDLLVDDVAFVNDQLHFDFKLTGAGYEGRPVVVRVRRKDDRRTLAETSVTLPKDGEARTVRLTIRPEEKGEFEYVVNAEPLPGETTAGNNSASRTVLVGEETIRVLYVAGYPNYDFRFLKTLLGRELKTSGGPRDGDETGGDRAGGDGEKAFVLKTVLQEADLEYAQQDETAERIFPVGKDDLFSYDVLVFGDCNPTFFGPTTLGHIAEFVKTRGGGAVFLSGPRFTPLAYRDTPLAELFPLSLDAATLPDPDAELAAPLVAAPTPLGLNTPFLQLDDSPEATLEAWRTLPPLYWTLEAPDVRPGARVLLETGGGDDSRPALPLVALQFVGAGKVIFHATDETWRWSRHRDGEQFYARYWIQMLRYLSRSRLPGGNRSVQLTTDREEYQRGETVRLRARFLDERLAPPQDDGVTVVLERAGAGKRNVQLVRDAAHRGYFEGTIGNLAEGAYRVWIATPTLEGQPPAARFSVVVPQGEQARLAMDAADMRAAAKTSSGRFYTLGDVDRLPDDLPPGRQVRIESLPPEPIWNRWIWPALFVTMIVGEWLLRKRAGML